MGSEPALRKFNKIVSKERNLKINGAARKLRAIGLLLSDFSQDTAIQSGFNFWIYVEELLEDIACDIDPPEVWKVF